MPKTALAPYTMRILFDSSVSPLPSRFADTLNDRHVIFVGQDFDLHLKICEDKRRRELHGQIIPHVPGKHLEPATVTLRDQGKPAAANTTSDESGEFDFGELGTGDFALEIMIETHRLAAFFSV